jgi:hypothetical protein
VTVLGATPAAAVVVNRLRRQQISVEWDSTQDVPDHLGLVSTGLLDSLDLPDQLNVLPLEAHVSRQLDELNWHDRDTTNPNSRRLRAISRRKFVQALIGRVGQEVGDALPKASSAPPMLLVDARDRVPLTVGDHSPGPPELADVQESIYLSWDGPPGPAAARSIKLMGEHLTDPPAQSRILIGSGVTTLIMSVQLRDVVEASVAVVDILHRLMSHSGVLDLIPTRTADRAWMRITTADDLHPIELNEGGRLRVGGAAGHAFPELLNIEIRSALIAAEQISAAVQEGRVTTARLSRIAREWKRAGLIGKSPSLL